MIDEEKHVHVTVDSAILSSAFFVLKYLLFLIKNKLNSDKHRYRGIIKPTAC
jgi:hypothetical protein